MNEWFYVEAGEQRGPVSATELAALHAAGRIVPATLLWREGWADWRPLSGVWTEVGLTMPAALPPTLPPSPPAVAAAQVAPSQAAASVTYAGFWRRWAALIVDGLVLAIPLLLVTVLIAIPIGLTSDSAEQAGLAAQGIYYLMYLVAAPLYYAGMESSAWQATLGKRLVGIKVCDHHGTRLGFAHALGRWAAATLSYLTLYVGFLLAAFTERKQALHDFIAGTVVVDRWAYSEFPDRQRTGNLGCLVIGLILLVPSIAVLGILAAIAIPTYQDYTVRARVAEVLAVASPAKLAVAEFAANTDRCPRGWEELGAAAPDSPLLRATDVGEFDDGRCAIELTLGAIEGLPDSAGQRIWLTREADGNWTCEAEVASKYLPAACR